MQTIKLKLDYSTALDLKKLMKVFLTVDELSLATERKHLELLAMATAYPLYLKLCKLTLLEFSNIRKLTLLPAESLVLYSIINITHFSTAEDTQRYNLMAMRIHQNSINTGKYIVL